MAKSKAEQLAALIISMELDELHDMSNMIQKLIEEKAVVEETEEQILTRRLLELRQKKGLETSVKEDSRNQNAAVLAKAGRTNQRAGTKQAREEPMRIGPRQNELYKYIKSDEAKKDTLDDAKLFGGRVERNRDSGLVVVQCDSCGKQVKMNASIVDKKSTFLCDDCIKGKGANR